MLSTDHSNGIFSSKSDPLEDYKLQNSEGKQQKVTLKQRISLFNGIAIILGVILGSGIFVSPKGVLIHTHDASSALLIWLICGIFSLFGALCYAELGTTIPKSGGDYAYIYEAFGKVPAFLFLWISLVIVNPTSIAVMALTFSNYILQPFYDGCEPPDYANRVIASSIIVLLTLVNCVSVRWSTRTQDVSTVTKVGALIIIVLAGITYLLLGNSHQNWSTSRSVEFSLPNIALAFYQGVFSYSGWNYLNFVTEEIKDPYKNLPRAIYISLPIVTIIYMLVNWAYFAVLSVDEILASPAVAFTFANKALGPFKHIMPFFVATSCIGAVNGIIFTSSRMFFAGARDGQLPEMLAMISIRYMTPLPSLLILGILSVLMLNVADVLVLINYLSFSESSVVAMSVLALVKMRIYNPDIPRPIKFNIAIPLIFLSLCGYILIAPFVRQPQELIAALVIILSGVPAYVIFVSWENKPNCFYRPWVSAMSDEKNDNADEIEEQEKPEKHNWGAADLKKVADVKEDDEQDNVTGNNVDHLKAEEANVISLRAEDIKLLTTEMELSRSVAERYLIKNRGDVRATIRNLMGLETK